MILKKNSILLFISVLWLVLVLAGCAAEKLLKTSHKKMPTWVQELPRLQGSTMYFYGVGKTGEQNDAERMAYIAAATRLSESLVVILRNVYTEKVQADPSKENVYVESISKSLTNNILQGMSLSDSYWELWKRGDEKYIVFHGRIAISTQRYEQLKNETKTKLMQEQSAIKQAEEFFKSTKHQEVINILYPLTSSGILVNEIYPLIYKSYAELKEYRKALEIVLKGIQFGVWNDQDAQFMVETQEIAIIDQIESQSTQISESIRNTEYLLRTCHSRSAFERAGAVYGRLKAKKIFEDTMRDLVSEAKIFLVGFFSSEGELLSPTDTFASSLINQFEQGKKTVVITEVLREVMDDMKYKRVNIVRLQKIAKQEKLKGIYIIRKDNCYYVQKTDSDNLVTATAVLNPSGDDWERRQKVDIFNIKSLAHFGCTPCNNTGKCDCCKGTGHETCPTCNGTQKILKSAMCTDCAGKGFFADKKNCLVCGGTGGPWKECATCEGSGTVEMFKLKVNCGICGGAGKHGCSNCRGQGSIPYNKPCGICNGAGKKYWHENCIGCNTVGRIKCRDCSGTTTCKYCVK